MFALLPEAVNTPPQLPPSPVESSSSYTSSSTAPSSLESLHSSPSPCPMSQPLSSDDHTITTPTLDCSLGQSRSMSRINIAHPYARLYAKKEGKRRKIWNHVLEKCIFNPYELSTLGAPHRRTIYMASLEAHIDRLHAQLLSIGFWPVAFDELDPYKGLNSKTAKSMVAGLQHDASHAKLKLLELERANDALRKTLVALESASSGVHQEPGLDRPGVDTVSGVQQL